MDEEVFEVTTEELDDTWVVRPVGDVDVATAPFLRAHLTPIDGKLIVDLTGVTFLSSAGISVLFDTYRRLGGGMTLGRPSDHVRMVLEVVGLEGLIEV